MLMLALFNASTAINVKKTAAPRVCTRGAAVNCGSASKRIMNYSIAILPLLYLKTPLAVQPKNTQPVL